MGLRLVVRAFCTARDHPPASRYSAPVHVCEPRTLVYNVRSQRCTARVQPHASQYNAPARVAPCPVTSRLCYRCMR
eukprot:3254012-Rhodomonas_salina.1